jgi:general secretion pathway protein H
VPARERRGFILLDLVLALAVFGLIVLVAWPLIAPGTSAARHAAYALEIAALLKDDRTAAARLQTSVVTRIDVFERRVSSGASARAVVLPGDLALDVLASQICSLGSGRFAIAFAADGRSCGAVIRIAKGERDWRVRINWLSGQIDVVASENG